MTAPCKTCRRDNDNGTHKALEYVGHLNHEYVPDRPEIVVLCGSTRFYDEFRRQNLRLTIEGKIVLSIGCDTKSDGDLFGQDDVEELKARLDELHKHKINLADRVLVLNVGGYIGESTRYEIEHAIGRGKPIDYLEPIPTVGGGCECWVTPEHMWTRYGDAVEPGSRFEWNPDCPKHPAAADGSVAQ